VTVTSRKTLAGAICVLVAVTASYYYQQLTILTLALLGRSPFCTWSEALRSVQKKSRQKRAEPQIISKDPAGYELWDTHTGPVWAPEGNGEMLRMLLQQQSWRIYQLGEGGVHPGDVVLDCGANIGFFTREALAAGAKLVVAIEPAPENLECLRRNLAAEIDARKVIVFPKGVWDRDELLTLHVVPGFSAADSFVDKHGGARERGKVPLTTVDKLVAELDLKQVDFIKMNVEGAERRALAGARDTLARFQPRLAVSTLHAMDDGQAIPRVVRDAWAGYQMQCGICSVDRNRFLILPSVVHFVSSPEK